jgi:subtilisin family serine protease
MLMKFRRTILILSVILPAFLTAAGQSRFAAGELLVKFRQEIGPGPAAKIARGLGATILPDVGGPQVKRIKLPKGMSVEKAVEMFRRRTDVEYAQPNYYYRLQTTPNDTLFPNAGMWGMAKISAPAAWDITTGSAQVVVADIDTGARYTHEDLAANIWKNPGEIPSNGIDDDGNGFVDDYYGYDFFSNDPDPWDEYGFGHGTHTAGTIGAVGNNSTGVVGVTWNIRIMVIKIYSAAGTDTTSAVLVNAHNYVRMMKQRGVNVRVTNNSYGGCPEACSGDKAVEDALNSLGDAGVLNVFAAGNANANNDVTPEFPASYSSPEIISVAASDVDDNKASFSSYGATSVDLAAPGLGIMSTLKATDSSYGLSSGTSMATQHVTGAAALLAASDPTLSAASLKATILNNVDPLANWNGVVKTGGRLNVAKALQNPTACSFALGTNTVKVGTKGGYVSVPMTVQPNCDFRVRSNDNWIFVEGSGVLSGSGSVTFRVTVNPTVVRTGTVTVAGQTLTVLQSRK